MQLDYRRVMPEALQAMVGLEKVAAGGLEPQLLELVKMRASQLNGCAYCLDMHARDSVYEQVRAELDEADTVALTPANVAINGWNRFAVGFRTDVGSYVSAPAAGQEALR